MMLKIVMDSAGDIPDEWRKDYDIVVIPVNIQFEDNGQIEAVILAVRCAPGH